MPRATPRRNNNQHTPPTKYKTPSKSQKQKKEDSHLQQDTFTQHQLCRLESSINKVIELRRIQSLKQIYEQLPMIKEYIYDAFEFGQLVGLRLKPSPKLIEILIEKQYR